MSPIRRHLRSSLRPWLSADSGYACIILFSYEISYILYYLSEKPSQTQQNFVLLKALRPGNIDYNNVASLFLLTCYLSLSQHSYTFGKPLQVSAWLSAWRAFPLHKRLIHAVFGSSLCCVCPRGTLRLLLYLLQLWCNYVSHLAPATLLHLPHGV